MEIWVLVGGFTTNFGKPLGTKLLRYFARVLVPQCVKGERAAFEFAVGHSAGLKIMNS